jgi:hypothetical protein
MVNTQAFVDHIFSLSPGIVLAKCPCNKCQNCSHQVKIDMERHLCKLGFMPNYERWYEHVRKMSVMDLLKLILGWHLKN